MFTKYCWPPEVGLAVKVTLMVCEPPEVSVILFLAKTTPSPGIGFENRLIVPLNPFRLVSVIASVVDVPAFIVRLNWESCRL